MSEDSVQRQYEAYPYPARDPAEEAERLVIGSPSHPLEIDHYLFRGARDWSQPFRALVAGGGTGDGLMMLAQVLHDWNVDAEIIYLDFSTASREIAEARAAARGLSNIAFHTGDLLTAPDHGPFDYIDCCGVLHHLPDPDAGFAALCAALKPEGGLGAMVYAPYGRAGVYEMQATLRALTAGEAPERKVELARSLIEKLPPTNGFQRNPFLADHLHGGDAGLYDLLLHDRDIPYDVGGVYDALERAGLAMVSFATPGRYDPRILIPDPELRRRAAALSPREQAALAERLAGNLKTHAFYAAPRGSETDRVAQPSPGAVPHLLNVSGSALAQSIWSEGALKGEFEGLKIHRPLVKEAAGVIAGIDGKRSLAQIRAMTGWSQDAFDAVFKALYMPLNNFNLLRFSRHGGAGRRG